MQSAVAQLGDLAVLTKLPGIVGHYKIVLKLAKFRTSTLMAFDLDLTAGQSSSTSEHLKLRNHI
jgi:hypothetical protein